MGCGETAAIYSTACNPTRTVKVSCSELPTIELAEEVLNAHESTVQRILDVDGEQVIVDLTSVEGCPDKAAMVIYHSSVEGCRQIKDIIDSNNFFGIPYGMYNG